MTLGEQLLNIAEAGIVFANDPAAGKDSFTTLAVLLDLEDSLDKGRSLIGDSGRDHLPKINEKMDILRGNIRTLIDDLPAAEVKKFMEARGERLKYQFSVSS